MQQLIRRTLTSTYLAVAAIALANHSTAVAGPWLDSLFHTNRPVYPVGAPVPVSAGYGSYGYATAVPYAANYGQYPLAANSYTSNYGSYPPVANAPLLPPGLPQTVAAQLPTAAYDTQWARTPVTYYRPVTQFDPRYGSTVTSLQPCTSYQYQAQRVPTIAPRPLLGDYGAQANRWPAINAPGYNPTVLGYAPQYATPITPVQQIPTGGVPIAPSYPVTAAYSQPIVPQTTVATPSYAVVSPTYSAAPAPAVQYAVPTYATPSYSTPTNATPIYGTTMPSNGISSGVTPAAAYQPSTSNVAPPNIPGATSVVPVGPPSYSATPNPSLMGTPSTGSNALPSTVMSDGSVMPPVGSATTPTLPNGASGFNPYSNGTGTPSPSDIMPPGVRSLNDPESTRQPSLQRGSINPFQNSDNTSTAFNLKRLPMSSIDRDETKPATSDSALAAVMQNAGNNVGRNAAGNPATSSTPATTSPSVATMNPPSVVPVPRNDPAIPSTLPRTTQMNALQAPPEFDTKPRWNPSLLDPKDRVPTATQPAKQADQTPAGDASVTTVSSQRVLSNHPATNQSSASSNGYTADGLRFVPIKQPR